MPKQAELNNAKQLSRPRSTARLPVAVSCTVFVIATVAFGAFCLFGSAPVAVVISWVPTDKIGLCAGSFNQSNACSGQPPQDQGFPFIPYYNLGSSYIALPPVDTFDNALQLTRVLDGIVALLGAAVAAVAAGLATKSIENRRGYGHN